MDALAAASDVHDSEIGASQASDKDFVAIIGVKTVSICAINWLTPRALLSFRSCII